MLKNALRSILGRVPSQAKRAADAESLALIPMLDLLNHRADAPTKLTWDAAQLAYVLVALETIRAGSEVHLSYGSTRNNDDLVLNFGFVLSPNPHDVLLVPDIAPCLRACAARLFKESDCYVPSAAEIESRLELLGRLHLSTALLATPLSSSGADAMATHAMRVVLASPSELKQPFELRRAASAATEWRVREAICCMCEEAIAELAGSSDLGPGNTAGNAERTRMALQFRQEKERVLRELVGRMRAPTSDSTVRV